MNLMNKYLGVAIKQCEVAEKRASDAEEKVAVSESMLDRLKGSMQKMSTDLKSSEELISNLKEYLKGKKVGALVKVDLITSLEARVKTLESSLLTTKTDVIKEFKARDKFLKTTCEYFDFVFEEFHRMLTTRGPSCLEETSRW